LNVIDPKSFFYIQFHQFIVQTCCSPNGIFTVLSYVFTWITHTTKISSSILSCKRDWIIFWRCVVHSQVSGCGGLKIHDVSHLPNACPLPDKLKKNGVFTLLSCILTWITHKAIISCSILPYCKRHWIIFLMYIAHPEFSGCGD